MVDPTSFLGYKLKSWPEAHKFTIAGFPKLSSEILRSIVQVYILEHLLNTTSLEDPSLTHTTQTHALQARRNVRVCTQPHISPW